MRDLANDVDLFGATIEFSLYHVGQQIKLDLWKDDIINWQFDSGAEFKATAADGLYDLNLPYAGDVPIIHQATAVKAAIDAMDTAFAEEGDASYLAGEWPDDPSFRFLVHWARREEL
jgi:hypothetical protein